MEINFTGEHLFPGHLGNLFLIVSFVAALVATVAFYRASKPDDEAQGWRSIARISFRIHSIAVIGVVCTLFYLIFNHYFEYYYVWHHSSKALPVRYMLSCFWEGQEGSFLLWSIWHVVLGNILLKTSKDWENEVMTVFSSTQVFLTSMLLGVVIFNYKLGSNPFTLLREHPDMANMPFTKVPNYLQNLDGRGLNPLLQNYWMTIHPPTLFLGFASTLVPFVYAIAGLWKKKYNDWQKPALPWTYFGIMILGTGILMGGAWAYESLSFGGFWAWDPVENASLVPWLTFVGAGHVMLINKNSGSSLLASFWLPIVTFILILYSTFLTRSGILGDTSVHAFTDLGMSGQLLVYLLFYVVLAIVLIVVNYKNMPKSQKEEELLSREFWMFIGALVLAISSFQIMFTTSIPVINKLFQLEKKIAPPTDVIAHYNNWQMPFAIMVAILLGFVQFLKYKNTDVKEFWRKMARAILISALLSLGAVFILKLNNVFYFILFLASTFGIVGNADYWISVLKGKVKAAGASVAHIGFGLILMGILISTGKKETISQNTSGVSVEQLGKDFKNNENILLAKGDTLKMGDYYVTYYNKYQKGINVYHQIDYLTKEGNSYKKEFTLEPLIQLNERMGNVAEPDTRHFLHKDVYTHITYTELEDKSKKDEGWKETENKGLNLNDTIFTGNAIIELQGVEKDIDKAKYKLNEKDLAVGLKLKAVDFNGKVYETMPLYVIRNNYMYPIESSIDELNLQFTFSKIDPATSKVDVIVKERQNAKKEFVVMKAIIFPGINILWLGCVIMIIGSVMAIYQRIKSQRLV